MWQIVKVKVNDVLRTIGARGKAWNQFFLKVIIKDSKTSAPLQSGEDPILDIQRPYLRLF